MKKNHISISWDARLQDLILRRAELEKAEAARLAAEANPKGIKLLFLLSLCAA